MDLSFSLRMGITQEKKPMQLESMDDDLRNSLWNIVQSNFLAVFKYMSGSYSKEEQFQRFCVFLWANFYKLPIDEIPDRAYQSESFMRDKFFKAPWYKVYDFLEFVVNTDTKIYFIYGEDKFDRGNFIEGCNYFLESENSGYRFINYAIVPITNTLEINEIEGAIAQSKQLTAFKGVNTHLTSALAKLSDRQAPDYRNSIKESISAVESVSKKISKGDRDTLGAALDKVKEKIKIHPALEKGFKQIYGYTSAEGGIRHAIMDETTIDFEDAKYMLVSCSAFINYLIVKADKAGIKFEDENRSL